jgi:hypothetical protein
VGPGPDQWTAPGSGPSAALAGDVRRARVAGGNREGRGVGRVGRGTVPGGGVADRRGRPVSGCGESAGGAQARVGQPEKKAGWPSPDEQ